METLSRETILSAFSQLNAHLRAAGVIGELCLYGGGAMVVAFNARLSTQDVDAVFQPAELIREAAKAVAAECGLPAAWLNDGVKGWLSMHEAIVAANLPQFENLRLTRPAPDYLLSMKCLAARTAGLDGRGDAEDIAFLARELGLHSAAEVLATVERYYPPARILPKTRFLVEEIMQPSPPGADD